MLVATWRDGLFVVSERGQTHELAGHAVRGLTQDGQGGVLAVVDGNTLRKRSADGYWSVLAISECDLACCVATQDAVYVGTETARVFRLEADQHLQPLRGFDGVEGRKTWAAGQALVNGQLLGPPLGVRSISAAPDGTLLANVHVGGIPRSTDRGISWHPTIEIECDVHEVLAHATRPGIVIAAAAAGLCCSRDGGATWKVAHEGLHARYCSAVAFVGDDAWVAASDGHFAPKGRIYRRPIDDYGPLSPLRDLPEWTDGIVDTHCMSATESRVALADQRGNLYVSGDSGVSWSRAAHHLPSPSSVLVA